MFHPYLGCMFYIHSTYIQCCLYFQSHYFFTSTINGYNLSHVCCIATKINYCTSLIFMLLLTSSSESYFLICFSPNQQLYVIITKREIRKSQSRCLEVSDLITLLTRNGFHPDYMLQYTVFI